MKFGKILVTTMDSSHHPSVLLSYNLLLQVFFTFNWGYLVIFFKHDYKTIYYSVYNSTKTSKNSEHFVPEIHSGILFLLFVLNELSENRWNKFFECISHWTIIQTTKLSMFFVSQINLGGPSDGRLLPRDQILSVNGMDVRQEDKLGVVEMIRKSTTVLKLEVAQPPRKVGPI
jgi:hypothetical protein